MPERSLTTPLGPVTLEARDGAITALHWRCGEANDDPLLVEAERQLTAYFAGRSEDFDLPFAPQGTDLTLRTCAALQAIPFGETRTYGDLAAELNVPAQAIGQACGANPIPVLIPCHRILGANGLGGFSAKGGVETKVWLLRHERAAGLLI
ncbi:MULTISPECIES: methylated-DNA--[protein]-cysteine S-methyltransferase [Roseobacteraceae]|uniref:methylated-DNA--[protein]-cysteine S-methyltransferase n=1 Tax=Roseobacteraceae TaxID=2854170 RepID=UPI002B26E5F2|nr:MULTISPECIES: methylated-DNA--[protein]-cysteine S-methyltransferase [Roseobacteraceae]